MRRGTHITEDHAARISAALKGKPKAAAHLKAMSKSRKQTSEARKLLAVRLKSLMMHLDHQIPYDGSWLKGLCLEIESLLVRSKLGVPSRTPVTRKSMEQAIEEVLKDQP